MAEEEQPITPEDQTSQKETDLEAFRASYKTCLEEIVEAVVDQTFSYPVPPHPQLLDWNDRSFDDLTQEELQIAQEELFKELGITPERQTEFLSRSYQTSNSEISDKKIPVSVYKTNKEGVFLQELTFQDGQRRWVIGPDEDLLENENLPSSDG